MSLSSSVRRAVRSLGWGLCLALPVAVSAQTNYYAANGTEYPIAGTLPGDQVWPDAAVSTDGGFVVWQDNATDGSGWGVSARRVDGTLSGTLSAFRVNVQGTNDQENPRVALLKNGGAAFVWQGGAAGAQHIFARLLATNNLWMTTNDLLISLPGTNVATYVTNVTQVIVTNVQHSHVIYITNTVTTISTNVSGMSSFQNHPALAVLNGGNVVVVWSSFNQAGSSSMLDVYGQLLSPTGQKIGTNFLINQFTAYNQRTPAVAALKNGGFVVAWVSEQERSVAAPSSGLVTPSQLSYASVDIYARLFDGNGAAQSGEFLVNQDANVCANPSVAASADGGFLVAWTTRILGDQTNGLDILARPFVSTGAGGTTVNVNAYRLGDQILPRASAIGNDYLVVWTSLWQDGSREGVYGRLVHSDGSLVSSEFRVNTTTLNSQMQPAVASDGASQFLVVWTGFTGIPGSFDLFAQRYANVASVLQPMAAPFVCAPFTVSNGVYQPQLVVSWPPLLGISVSNYEIYVDGVEPPSAPMATTTNNVWTMTAASGLTASSTHSFRVDYVTTDNRRALLSPAATGTTWGGLNYYGIPYEWMQQYYGLNIAAWPAANALLAPGGLTLMQVFQSGGNPLDPSTWLKTTLTKTSEGMFLSWNTQAGFTYQVQMTTNFGSWINLGAPRFAAGNTDSIFVGGGPVGYYRVMLLRP
ncbi:MAG TPA: hypothetical protein VMB80_10395 [Candidatus Acidoferrum sp.]|nr:hypothetical protein [Candidatus Acidoferrum sp.]